jgi:hypothetical protein
MPRFAANSERLKQGLRPTLELRIAGMLYRGKGSRDPVCANAVMHGVEATILIKDKDPGIAKGDRRFEARSLFRICH